MFQFCGSKVLAFLSVFCDFLMAQVQPVLNFSWNNFENNQYQVLTTQFVPHYTYSSKKSFDFLVKFLLIVYNRYIYIVTSFIIIQDLQPTVVALISLNCVFCIFSVFTVLTVDSTEKVYLLGPGLIFDTFSFKKVRKTELGQLKGSVCSHRLVHISRLCPWTSIAWYFNVKINFNFGVIFLVNPNFESLKSHFTVRNQSSAYRRRCT